MKKKYNFVLLFIFIVCLSILILILSKKENEKVNNSIENKVIYSLVIDYNDFYTIENCANKYFNYLSVNDIDSVNKLLDENYKSSNQINNIFSNFLGATSPLAEKGK